MKIISFTVQLCIFISLAGIRLNFTEPTSPQHSAQNESTKEDNRTLPSALKRTESGRSSDNSESGNDQFLNSPPVEISIASTGLNALNGCGSFINRAINNQTSRSPNQYRGGVSTRPPSYTRVFVGKDISGSKIFTSSSSLKRATSLAEVVRVVYGKLEILQNPRDVKKDGKSSANSLPKQSTKRKRSSNESANSTRGSLPSFGSTFGNVHRRSDQDDVGYNRQNLENEKHTKFTISKRQDDATSSDPRKKLVSSTGSSGLITLNLNQKLAYDCYTSSYHRALINACSSFDEPAIVGNITITRSLITLDKSCSYDLEQSSAGLGQESGVSASEEVRPETPPGRPFERELASESCYATAGQHSSTRLESRASGDAKMDDSLNNFVAAVSGLQLLVEDLDVYFGSARRLRTSLVERPLESGNLIEEISCYLVMMTGLTNPGAVALFGTASEYRLGNVSHSVMYFNEEIWGHIIAINDFENSGDEHGTIEYLLSILRELRNEVSGVVESAQPVIEYFHGLLNAVKNGY